MAFTYVNVIGKGYEGWLNLFFGDYCVALVNNAEIAAQIRATCKEYKANGK